MARLPRYVLPGQPQHVIQRGNNRAAVFFRDEDYRLYLHYLGEACMRHCCEVHAYVLMSNHVHLLLTPGDESGISKVMQSLGSRYAQYVNSTYRRTGTLWDGRYRSTVVDPDVFLLPCMHYVELNPVRTDIVSHPRLYRWSSYRCNAEGEPDLVVRTHAAYERLAETPGARQEKYRALARVSPDEETFAAIRNATNKGWVLGGSAFRERLEAVLNRRMQPLPRGGDRRSKRVRPQDASIASDPFVLADQPQPTPHDEG